MGALIVSDRPVDLLEDGLDVAVRVRRLPGSSLKARRLGIVEVVLQPFEVDRMPIYAVLSPTKLQPAKVKLFVDLLSTQLRTTGL